MKKYFKPWTETGIDAVYSISIGLETWAQYLNAISFEDDKSQIYQAAQILHKYCFQQKFKHWG